MKKINAALAALRAESAKILAHVKQPDQESKPAVKARMVVKVEKQEKMAQVLSPVVT